MSIESFFSWQKVSVKRVLYRGGKSSAGVSG